ncbi:MAG: MetS family NSS transporter small subunit [Calditrichaeota bacterium]|nr:MAG: MetS family NSS transporter small subunit [Calditrichota bacterium]
MSFSAIITMLVVLGFTWGAFIFSILLAVKKEKLK